MGTENQYNKFRFFNKDAMLTMSIALSVLSIELGHFDMLISSSHTQVLTYKPIYVILETSIALIISTFLSNKWT